MRAEYENNEVIASKRLSHYKIVINNPYCKINVIWCRTVYAYNEEIRTEFHNHSFYEIHYILSGSCAVILDGKREDLYRREYIVIFPGRTHKFIDSSKDFSKLVFGFEIYDNNGEIRKAIDKTDNGEKKRGSEIIEGIVDLMLKTAFYRGEYVLVLLRNMVQCLLVEFIRINEIDVFKEKQELKEKDMRLEMAERFIRDNVDTVTVEMVAAQVFLSVRHLNRMFNENIGMSISDMIQREKMKRIKYLLETTQMPIAEISELTGFSSEYSLSRFFKRVEGIPPGRYRQDCRK